MECTEFLELLASLLRGEISAAKREACESHIDACADCLEAWTAAVLEVYGPEESERTSELSALLGPLGIEPCFECEELLCDFADGVLDRDRARLVEFHLRSCSACRSLAGELTALSEDLRRLAELPVPESVLGNVLREIARDQAEAGARRSWQRFAKRSLLARPRFALEGAFAMTVVWMAIFGVPSGDPVASVAEASTAVGQVQVARALDLAASGLHAGFGRVRLTMVRGVDSLGSLSARGYESAIEVSSRASGRLWRQMQNLVDRDGGTFGST